MKLRLIFQWIANTWACVTGGGGEPAESEALRARLCPSRVEIAIHRGLKRPAVGALLGALALGFAGCASTEVRENGRCVFRTQADAQSIELTTKNTHLVMQGVNHSAPTLAGGQAFKMGADSVGTTVVSGILAGGLPWAKATAAGTELIPQVIAPAVLQSKH